MAKTIEKRFETLISRLAPLQSEHSTAASHKGSVKSCFENNFDCYEFFETGSFGNGTGVRHYSDTDYFAVSPKDKISRNSATALREAKVTLQETFWSTDDIEVRTPSVRIGFGIRSSETLEITPTRFNGMIDSPVGSKPYYDIPDFGGGWIQSSPKAHNAYVTRENNRVYGKMKPLIQLIKAWKFYNSVPISSFYLELRVAKYAEGEKSIIYDVDVRHIMKKLYDNNLADIRDPMGISGYVRACSSDAKLEDALSRLNTGYTRADKAYDQRNNDIDKAFEWWDRFFNGKFPSRY
jgi:hypothetical protein